MPDTNDLMDIWPQEMENVFNQIPLPGPEIDLDLQTYATIMCGLLDIPAQKLNNNRGIVEALHMIFTLYSNFKENQHFRSMGHDSMHF